MAAPRSNWKGYLKLSLVSCSIALYPASSSSARIAFKTLNRATGNRVKRQFVDEETGAVVQTADQMKGYPLDKENFLPIEEEDLDEVRVESSHTIEIDKFVPRAGIDPRFVDTPYYIAPDERVGQEAFAVIRDAMAEEKVAGLGRVVIARRERIIMIEPWGKGLLGTILRYAYEVRGEEPYFEAVPDTKIERELKDMAKLIISRKRGEFDPKEFTDRYEEAMVEMIRAKQRGFKAPRRPEHRPTNIVDLTEALRASLRGAGREKAAEAPAPKQKRVSAAKAERDRKQPQLKLPIPGGKKEQAAAEPVARPARSTRKAS